VLLVLLLVGDGHAFLGLLVDVLEVGLREAIALLELPQLRITRRIN
jgi:hypothetical protein